MPSIRIVAAGVFLFAVLVMAGGGTVAQATTGAEPGKPIQLVPNLTQSGKAKAKHHHAEAATRRVGKRHLASAKAKSKHPVETAEAHPPANNWPGAEPAASTQFVPPNVMPTDVAAAAPATSTAAAFAEPVPNELVVGGRTVQVVSPSDTNELDLAADTTTAAATAAPDGTATAGTEANEPAAQTAFVAQTHDDAGPVGSASWIAQVLAALGGAVAAGSVAWFLIGASPQRTYG